MKLRQLKAHMAAAHVYAQLSYSKRAQVGCVIVTAGNVVYIGYNGTPPGEDNCCENDIGLTKSNVIHAEINAIKKFETALEHAQNTILLVTMSPCLSCAKRIVEMQIPHVIYDKLYINEFGTHDAGIKYLQQHSVLVEQITTMT